MSKAAYMRADRESRVESALKALNEEPQVGTFRLRTPQSHTRFEGPRRRHKHTYYGNGQPKAALGGDVIRFTARELDRFPDARQRFELVDGKWHNKVDIVDVDGDDATPPPNKIEIILAHRVGDIEGLIHNLEARDLRAVLAYEFGERGKGRKGVRDAVEELLATMDDD